MDTISPAYHLQTRTAKTPVFRRFINWCTAQDHNRYQWLAVILGVHGTILTPFTFLAVLAAGAGFACIPFVIAAMAACLISNLAAMPTRITIPIFAGSVIIDLVILAISLGKVLG